MKPMKKVQRLQIKIFFHVLFISAILFAAVISEAKLRVAVIDTGINWYLENKLPICGLYDVTGYGVNDTHGHGSHVAATIAKYAGNSDYCLVIIKFYDPRNSAIHHGRNSTRALQLALDLKLDIVNYSGGGDEALSSEADAIQKLIKTGVVINAAAGNESKAFSKHYCFYPACYTGVNIIGANRPDSYLPLKGSNWGVMRYRLGTVEVEVEPGNVQSMSGTSQATALFTGEMIREKSQYRIAFKPR